MGIRRSIRFGRLSAATNATLRKKYKKSQFEQNGQVFGFEQVQRPAKLCHEMS
ncbi:hypothetical protein COCSUDRAFT_33863 [Coccomyxa subellipsoidea C-169]|uniref:Uncharacterized protein n=1 Tax=Coccomyxa subellipsoidea (strain C-169) TaxID=574566 RepID=I0YQN8_COCSC|nr:hypothetical protein COCSUDRAFT_33863 [Coccomyxa subellipsoidea C-169]EIE20707.1 hypothetical protein COCSUDRAFT_33863 [Coccomyxa subellipsoidea C-169]|eukprot:XP_005645251.1 hypothetical protein COCSUDRAFT_33863 [Coccomyxa subellipsoidea C-169]